MDEFKLRADTARAAQAKALLDSELLSEAFLTLEATYIDAWKSTGARDSDARERLWQATQIVGKVKAHLEQVAANGSLAQRELDEIERLGERKKVLGVF